MKHEIKKQLTTKEKTEECPVCKEKIKIVVTGSLVEFKDKNDVKHAQIKGTHYEGVTIECFKCGTLLIFTRGELIE